MHNNARLSIRAACFTRRTMANLAAQIWDLFMSERFCVYRNIVAVVGIVFLLERLLAFLSVSCGLLRAYFLAPWGIMRTDLKKFGSWAVVTGASEGIGKGYAVELARRGLNVVIMSRSKEKLEKVSQEIKEKYNREVLVIPVDFSKGQEVYEDIRGELGELDIGVLVNNVGLSYEYPDFILDVPAERLRQIVELNCQAMVQMTHLIAPSMVTKKRGLVVNVSSFASAFPLPLLGVYAASKVFVNFFSATLRKEYAGKGIVVQNIAPLLVVSAMSKIKRSSYTVPSPTTFARAAVASIGQLDSTPGCFSHALQEIVMSSIPDFLRDHVTWSGLMGERKKALQRKEQKKRED